MVWKNALKARAPCETTRGRRLVTVIPVMPFIRSYAVSSETITTTLTRANAFVIGMAAALLLPLFIPGVGLDYGSSIFLIALFVLFGWFIFRWDRV